MGKGAGMLASLLMGSDDEDDSDLGDDSDVGDDTGSAAGAGADEKGGAAEVQRALSVKPKDVTASAGPVGKDSFTGSSLPSGSQIGQVQHGDFSAGGLNQTAGSDPTIGAPGGLTGKSGSPGKPEGSWMDTAKQIKGYTPGHGAAPIQMQQTPQIGAGAGAAPQSSGQSPQFQALMQYLQQQKQGMM